MRATLLELSFKTDWRSKDLVLALLTEFPYRLLREEDACQVTGYSQEAHSEAARDSKRGVEPRRGEKQE